MYDVVRADMLQKLVVPNLDMTKCKEEMEDCVDCGPIYPNLQLCAGGVRGKDSCNGDSGSGMFDVVEKSNTKKIKYKIVGIVSWGTIRCGVAKPGIYVKVSAYLDWILNSLSKS